MPTVTQWQQALTRQYQLRVESSSALCADVNSVQQRRALEKRRSGKRPLLAKPPTPWPAGSQSHPMMIRPVDMLHVLGRITTPPITELIDLSSTWAEIRYLWAFVPNFDPNRLRALRLNPTVKALDFHQKTLLSDEFGVGFAAYFMFVCARASDPVDVFVAKRGGQVRLRGNSRRSLPDYIFSGPQPGQFFILECKGTQSSRATAINQLQRGAEQVLTVDIAGAQNVTRLIIAAWLQQAITLLIVDPEEEDDRSVEVRKLSRWEPEDVSLFADAKRLTYIGDLTAASELVRERMEPWHEFPFEERQFEERKLVPRETPYGKFLGSQWQAQMPDGRLLRMYRGLERKVYDQIRHRTSEPQDAEKSRIRRGGEFHVESEGNLTEAVVRSVAPDGSLLEIEIR
jgi:hypothetical protein